MNNNRGFTLIELLATLMIISLAFVFIFNVFKGTYSLTEKGINEINDTKVFESARLYVMEVNKSFNDKGYTCLNISTLVDYGYLKYDSYEDKIIKITRNKDTYVIEKIEYVDECE